MVEEKKAVRQAHNIILENRNKLVISGVSDVDSFDEENITVFTDLGELKITGHNLHIIKLSVEIGELKMEGEVSSLTYIERQPQGEGFFARLFK